jgi:hypothetical protein
MTLRSLVLTAAILMAGCTEAIDVHSARSPVAHFERYRTFAYETDVHAPSGFTPPPPSLRVEQDAERFVAEALRDKGYVLTSGGPTDMRIRLYVGRRRGERREPAHGPPGWLVESENEEEDFVEGALVIDVVDASGDLVWHGAARTEIDPGHVEEQLLRRAVNKVLSSFPGR